MFYNLHLNLLLKTMYTSLFKQLFGSLTQRYGQSWDWKMDQQPYLANIFEMNQETVPLENCQSGENATATGSLRVPVHTVIV